MNMERKILKVTDRYNGRSQTRSCSIFDFIVLQPAGAKINSTIYRLLIGHRYLIRSIYFNQIKFQKPLLP